MFSCIQSTVFILAMLLAFTNMSGAIEPVTEPGPKNVVEATGPQGPRGEVGPKGERGEKGDRGDAGVDGKNGIDAKGKSSSEWASFWNTVIGAVLGSGLAFLFTYFNAWKMNRRGLLWEMHTEFNGEPLNSARWKADKFLEKHPNESFQELYDAYPEETANVWPITAFYERLWLAIKHHRIHEELVPDVFGHIFYYWFITTLKPQALDSDTTTKNWDSSLPAIEELELWLRERETDKKSNKKSERFNKWVERGERARNARTTPEK